MDEFRPKSRATFLIQVVAGVTAYLEDPAARTLDVVPSTAVFLMQAHVALLAGDLGDLPLEKLTKLVAEEEARRVQPGSGDSGENIHLGLDLSVCVEESFEK